MGLSRETVLEAAVALADESGSGAPSMRALGKRLGVEAMSLYHHFRNKELILDGMVDHVFTEIDLPDGDWAEAMRVRAVSLRAALVRHPWAVSLLDSRKNPGPATLRHHDAVIGCLRAGGFTLAGAAHALSLLDSYVYGFTLQDQSLPFTQDDSVTDVAGAILANLPHDEYPHLSAMITDHALRPDYDHAAEFGIGLDLIIDGLRRLRESWR